MYGIERSDSFGQISYAIHAWLILNKFRCINMFIIYSLYMFIFNEHLKCIRVNISQTFEDFLNILSQEYLWIFFLNEP